MTTIVHARPERRITTTGRNYPLLNVLLWELRRFRASRLFWFQTLGFFCFLLFLTWALHAAGGFTTVTNNGQINVFIAGTSARGLFRTLPTVLLVLMLFLPFVTADGVTRDLSRRTHELLMASALPTRAYVWGRFLASLMMSLGMALLLLASILAMGGLLHLTDASYPLPQVGTVLLLWVGMVLPATILASSFGFALSTLFPRLSTLGKVVILVGWIVGGEVIPRLLSNTTLPPWYVDWDPTSGITALELTRQYPMSNITITSEAQLQQVILTLENKVPDLAGWFVPHLLLAVLGLGLVLVVAFAFKRSRDVLN